jgi:hypothetical protein
VGLDRTTDKIDHCGLDRPAEGLKVRQQLDIALIIKIAMSPSEE